MFRHSLLFIIKDRFGLFIIDLLFSLYILRLPTVISSKIEVLGELDTI